MMDINEFVENIKNILSSSLPEELQNAIYVTNHSQDRGYGKVDLSIANTDLSEVTVAMDTVYDNYVDRVWKIEEAASYVAVVCRDKGEKVNKIVDFQEAKKRLTCKLINARNNEKMLLNMPHSNLKDMAVVYQVELRDVQMADIPVTYEMLGMWKKSLDDLHRLAVENTQRLHPLELQSLQTAISGVQNRLNEPVTHMQVEDTAKSLVEMYVLSNKEQYLGAAAILYEGLLESIAERMESDYYMLPLNIHELMLVEKSEMLPEKEVGKVFADLARKYVTREEQLSRNVYTFNRKTKSIEQIKYAVPKPKRNRGPHR